MDRTPKTAELLRKLQRDKEIYGVHPCCFALSTGPHTMECAVEHPGPYYQ